MNLGRAVLNSGSWKKIWTNYPNWIYTVKIFYHDVTFSRFAVGRNTLPKLGLKLTISWNSSLKGPDLQQSMIKGQFTKNGTFINILAILRPIWPQLCMLNKSASHLRTSFLVLVENNLFSSNEDSGVNYILDSLFSHLDPREIALLTDLERLCNPNIY